MPFEETTPFCTGASEAPRVISQYGDLLAPGVNGDHERSIGSGLDRALGRKTGPSAGAASGERRSRHRSE